MRARAATSFAVSRSVGAASARSEPGRWTRAGTLHRSRHPRRPTRRRSAPAAVLYFSSARFRLITRRPNIRDSAFTTSRCSRSSSAWRASSAAPLGAAGAAGGAARSVGPGSGLDLRLASVPCVGELQRFARGPRAQGVDGGEQRLNPHEPPSRVPERRDFGFSLLGQLCGARRARRQRGLDAQPIELGAETHPFRTERLARSRELLEAATAIRPPQRLQQITIDHRRDPKRKQRRLQTPRWLFVRALRRTVGAGTRRGRTDDRRCDPARRGTALVGSGDDAREASTEMQLAALAADPQVDHAKSSVFVRMPSFRIHDPIRPRARKAHPMTRSRRRIGPVIGPTPPRPRPSDLLNLSLSRAWNLAPREHSAETRDVGTFVREGAA